MKIVFLLDHYYPYIGGAEQISQALAEALAASGDQVTVVTTRHSPNLAVREVLNGVLVHRVPCRSRSLFPILGMSKVWKTCRDCDLIHTAPYFAALPAWITAKLRRKKIVISFYEVWSRLWWELPFINQCTRVVGYILERILLRLPFDSFVAGSNFTEQELLKAGVSAETVTRIYFGVRYDEFKNYLRTKPDTFTYTFFGRLGVSKGLNLLIQGAARFQSNFPEARFKLIIPTQPARLFRSIVKLLEQEGISESTELIHDLPREELLKQIASSSCVVIPSLSEGFCFAAVEAGALEVPILASRRGALSEVVSGRHILMDDPDPAEIHKALVQARLGRWELRPRRYFKVDDTVSAFRRLYKGILESGVAEEVRVSEESFSEDRDYRRSIG